MGEHGLRTQALLRYGDPILLAISFFGILIFGGGMVGSLYFHRQTYIFAMFS